MIFSTLIFELSPQSNSFECVHVSPSNGHERTGSKHKKKMLTASENYFQSQPQEFSHINTVIYTLGTVFLRFF